MTCEKHARHNEEMRKLRLDPEYKARERAQQRSESRRARKRERYAGLDGYTYNKLLLRHRRNKALARMAKRHVPKEKEA